MIVTLWGARGSVACAGPETVGYGGNTSSVEVRGSDGTILILDAGTGIRRLGLSLEKKIKRVDILLTHLHLDHIQGLGFFVPLYDPDMEVHIYGPAKSNHELHKYLAKYLSPPLFPVIINDLQCKLYLHAVPMKNLKIGEFQIFAQKVCHPGLTMGYRITSPQGTVAYLPDHEPALGNDQFPLNADWTSGYEVAMDADLLLHDAQYATDEYPSHEGWGHSAIYHAILFAKLARVKKLITFHHDPGHSDEKLDAILEEAKAMLPLDTLKIERGKEGCVFKLPEEEECSAV